MRIYTASSWKNDHYNQVLSYLRLHGHEPLDWRSGGGFGWQQTGVAQEGMTAYQYRDVVLKHPRAAEGFNSDYTKMAAADACILLLPCGRSAHLEAGWFWGQGKPLHIYIPLRHFDTPELMYLGADSISFTLDELTAALSRSST